MAVALGLLPAMAGATPVCRWVDAQGHMQVSDIVPQQYAQSASCSDSRQYELSPQQQREAQRQAAAQQDRLRQGLEDSPDAVAEKAPASPSEESLLGAKRPTEVITGATDCPTRWRIYDESVACLGPYRTTQGAIKPEGFDHCWDIGSPEVHCGPRRN